MVLAFDALVIVGAWAAAIALHGVLRRYVPAMQLTPSVEQVSVLLVATVPPLLLALAWAGTDRVFERRWTLFDLLFDLGRAMVVGFTAIAALTYITQAVLNRSLTLLFVLITFVALSVTHLALIRWARFQHRSGVAERTLLLVGAASDAMRAFIDATKGAALPPRVIGRVAVDAADTDSAALPVLGERSSLESILHQNAVDEVLFFPPLNRPELAVAELTACETVGVRAAFMVELPKVNLATPRVDSEWGTPFVTFDVAPKAPGALALKHALDVLAAALLLVLLGPVLLLAAAGVVLFSGLPVLFRQERAGRFGRTFQMIKFRTMAVDAEAKKAALAASNEVGGPVFKMTRDPRITGVGRFLRKFSIDELPQLFHVLTGKMSLVGPRPLPVGEQAQMRGWHRRRLSMKPGITGLWQVSGRSDLDFEQWMKLDLEYVDHWSLALDLKILLKTIPVVLLGRGAK